LKKYITLFLLFGFISCKNEVSLKTSGHETLEKTQLSYAKGFAISNYENFSVLTVKSPWPKSEKSYTYALVQKKELATLTLNKDDFDGIITIPIEKIVVTSTTHIPALDLLGVSETLVGFPGTDYISSDRVRNLIDNKKVKELGKNESINTEVLLEIKPDVVIGFGIDGNNKTFKTIQKAGINVMYNGDWVESSPLAKAEWIKFFGALYDKETKADSIFNSIANEYLKAKKLAENVKEQPTVLSGALEKDVWYLPSGTSPEAQLLKDANVNYLWQDKEGQGSLALSFEAVFSKAKTADIWLSPSYYHSFEALADANKHYTEFDAFKNKNVFSFVNTTGKTGGITYFEEGTARPDLVLKDLIKICHPEVLKNYVPHFFKPLK